jgi:DNA-binding Lrp family transcriptional regulator
MPGAYVIITTLPGMEHSVLEQVAEIPHVVSVEGVYGDFDIIVRIEIPGSESLEPVVRQIRKVHGIRFTKTVRSIEGERKSGTGTDHLGAPSD